MNERINHITAWLRSLRLRTQLLLAVNLVVGGTTLGMLYLDYRASMDAALRSKTESLTDEANAIAEAVNALGWVTAMKDGEVLLDFIESETAHPQPQLAMMCADPPPICTRTRIPLHPPPPVLSANGDRTRARTRCAPDRPLRCGHLIW